jgi:hypothetical protein
MRMHSRAEAAEQRTMECSEKLRAEIAQLQGELSRRAHSPAYLRVLNCKCLIASMLLKATWVFTSGCKYRSLETCTRGASSIQSKYTPKTLAIHEPLQELRLAAFIYNGCSGSAARHDICNKICLQDAGAAGRGPHSQPHVRHTADAARLAGAGWRTACRGPLVWCGIVSGALSYKIDSE